MIREMLCYLGATNFALFGGAIRDACLERTINDYDIRIGMNKIEADWFIDHLEKHFVVSTKISEGTGKIRHCFEMLDATVDLSIRHYTTIESYDFIAQERAMDADIGISAVATSGWTDNTYARSEFFTDMFNGSLTVYAPDTSNDLVRIDRYVQKIGAKFPGRKVNYLT
jgi:hypothetical protein